MEGFGYVSVHGTSGIDDRDAICAHVTDDAVPLPRLHAVGELTELNRALSVLRASGWRHTDPVPPARAATEAAMKNRRRKAVSLCEPTCEARRLRSRTAYPERKTAPVTTEPFKVLSRCLTGRFLPGRRHRET